MTQFRSKPKLRGSATVMEREREREIPVIVQRREEYVPEREREKQIWSR